jgi:hypothetical protein
MLRQRSAGPRAIGWRLMCVRLTVIAGLGAATPAQTPDGPHVIRWHNPNGPSRDVGRLYTPETLSRLTAQRPPDAIPPRIAEAIRQQMAVIVMWTFPPLAGDSTAPSRPYRIVIADHAGGATSPDRIEPAWIQQDADALREIDDRTTFQEIGASAAFPSSAFVPGRQVIFHSQPIVLENGAARTTQVFGTIEWDGARGFLKTGR